MSAAPGERVALVTDGIGRAVALRLARGGERVLFADRSTERGARVLAALREERPGVDHAFLPADLSLLSETARVADEVARLTDRLDAAVIPGATGFPSQDRKADMTKKAAIEETTHTGGARAVLVGVAMVLAALLLALAGVADTAEAKKKKDKKVEKIVFSSDRTSGTGVNNPTGDDEIFVMNPDGTELEQLTTNTVGDRDPTLSPDGEEIAFTGFGARSTNPEGDTEVYLMDADGSGQQNLTDTASGVFDSGPDFAHDGEEIAYESVGDQTSNPENDVDIYLMDADGSGRQNLTDTAGGIEDVRPAFSHNGKKIAYGSIGVQSSNPEGDEEVYLMKTDGSDQRNLTDTEGGVFDGSPDYSPDGKKIAYVSFGIRSSNPEGDEEIYSMKDDGSKQKNRSDTDQFVGDDSPDYSPGGEEISYDSDGDQTSNPEGDEEVYLMDADGSDQRNLTNTGVDDEDSTPDIGEVEE